MNERKTQYYKGAITIYHHTPPPPPNKEIHSGTAWKSNLQSPDNYFFTRQCNTMRHYAGLNRQ